MSEKVETLTLAEIHRLNTGTADDALKAKAKKIAEAEKKAQEKPAAEKTAKK